MIITSKVLLAEVTEELATKLQYMSDCYVANYEQVTNFNLSLSEELYTLLKQEKLTMEEYTEELQQGVIILRERLISDLALKKQIQRMQTIQQMRLVTCLHINPNLDRDEVKCYLDVIRKEKTNAKEPAKEVFLIIMQQELEKIKIRLANDMHDNQLIIIPILPDEELFAQQLSVQLESAFIEYINGIAKTEDNVDEHKIALVDELLECFDFLKQVQSEYQNQSLISVQEKKLLDNLCRQLFFTAHNQIKQLVQPDANVDQLLAHYKKETLQCFNEIEEYMSQNLCSPDFTKAITKLCNYYDIHPKFLSDNPFIKKTNDIKAGVATLNADKEETINTSYKP